MKSESKIERSQKKVLIVLVCILLAALTVLVLIFLNNKPETNEQIADTQVMDTAEINSDDTREMFVPGKNDKIVQAVDDLDYCVLTMRYYFNEEGKLYRVFHIAEYLDSNQAKMDYAIMESMKDFSECSIEDNTIMSALTQEGIENNYPDATFDGVIEYITSKEMKYEIIQ